MIRHLLPLLLLPLVAVAADPPKAKTPGKGTSYAFLVGCARYDPKVLEPIKGEETINDVIEFKKALLATGFEEKHIVLLHDRQAEKGGAGAAYLPEHDKIVKELDLFLAGLTKDDTAVVVLSGHGVHFKGDKTGFFCPVDADIRAKAKLLPFDGEVGIYTQLEKCKAGRKLLIANACRDAPVVPTNDLAGGKIELDDDAPENVPKGIAAIYSCEKTQKSYFDPKQGRSYFFLHLTEAWKAGGNLEDVFAATRTKTMNDVKTARKEKQFPEVKRKYDGEWVVTVGFQYDPSGDYRFVHFGKDGTVWVVVMKSDRQDQRVEVWVVDPVIGKTIAGPFKHNSQVLSAVFSPDGTTVATASMDKTAAVWNTKTGEKIATLKHDETVRRVVFSPDGTRVLSASEDKTAAVWDAKTGDKVASFKNEHWSKYSAFSPDGVRVITANEDKAAVVWDAKTGDKITTLKHDRITFNAVFSPDGSKVVTTGEDNNAVVWDARKGDKLLTLKQDRAVIHAAFSPDGSKLVTTSMGDGVAVWDAKSGGKMTTLKLSSFEDIAVFSLDGSKVVTKLWKDVRVFDTTNGEQLLVIYCDHEVTYAAFSPDGSKVVTASYDGTATLWNAKSGKKLGSHTPK